MLGLRPRAGDDVRAVWLLALCALGGGSWLVQSRYQAAITSTYARTETLYRETLADARLIRESAGLHEIEVQADEDLARISRDVTLSGTTADFLGALQRSAASLKTTVLGVEPVPAGALPVQGLDATGLTIRAQGKFRSLLRLVEDLSHHSTLIDVSDTEMMVDREGRQDASDPRLDATIHATLYRLRTDSHKEVRVATAP